MSMLHQFGRPVEKRVVLARGPVWVVKLPCDDLSKALRDPKVGRSTSLGRTHSESAREGHGSQSPLGTCQIEFRL
jgi:hypothetical protein